MEIQPYKDKSWWLCEKSWWGERKWQCSCSSQAISKWLEGERKIKEIQEIKSPWFDRTRGGNVRLDRTGQNGLGRQWELLTQGQWAAPLLLRCSSSSPRSKAEPRTHITRDIPFLERTSKSWRSNIKIIRWGRSYEKMVSGEFIRTLMKLVWSRAKAEGWNDCNWKGEGKAELA